MKCYYHPKTTAATKCVGCKMLVCATCRDEGSKGLCDQCVRKRGSLAEPSERRGTGKLPPLAEPAERRGGTGKLPPLPGPATAQRPDVVYCHRHVDIRAAAACTTCRRPYCPACLNTAGICGVCAKYNKEAQAIAFNPNEKGRAVLEEMAAEARAKRLQPRDYAVVAVLVVGLAVSWKVMTKPPAKTDETRETLERLKASDLSAEEAALLAGIRREKRVTMKPPPPAHTLGGGVAFTGGPVAGGAIGGDGGEAAPAGDPGAPPEIAATWPVDGTIVGGVTAIRASVAGRAQRVVCEVDGTLVGATAGSMTQFRWDTRKAGNGPHSVLITAYGAGGSTATAAFTLNVLNR